MKCSFLLQILSLNIIIRYSICPTYHYESYDETTKYTPGEIDTSKYNSTDSCVTVFDLIAFHYTARLADIEPKGNVFPENFCYGIINYNITREDFKNIIDKNANAFRNYRSLIPFYIFANYTGNDLVDDGCIGYYRLIACLSEFPACQDEADGTFTVHPICSSICTTFERRCSHYYIDSFCKKSSKNDYCPSTHSDRANFLQFNILILLLSIFLF